MAKVVPDGYVEVFTSDQISEGTSICFFMDREWLFGVHTKVIEPEKQWQGWDRPNNFWAQWSDDAPGRHAFISSGDGGVRVYAQNTREYDLDQELDSEEDLL